LAFAANVLAPPKPTSRRVTLPTKTHELSSKDQHNSMAMRRSANPVYSSICRSCQIWTRSNASRRALSTTSNPHEKAERGFDDVEKMMQQSQRNMQNSPRNDFKRTNPSAAGEFEKTLSPGESDLFPRKAVDNLHSARQGEDAHRFHVYATKHNTHITLVQPPRPASETASLRLAGAKSNAADRKKMVDTLISLSAGNIGFKKAGRGSYDAGFQLAAFVLRQMTEKGMMRNMRGLQVVLRGFGAGREAVTKALLGSEGRIVRKQITSVVDATRLKQGGPRGKKPRRLG
jgi:small subunit ribosomal protein S11